MSNTHAARKVALHYQRPSETRFDGARSEVFLALDASRTAASQPGSAPTAPGPALSGEVKDGALLRDALSALLAVRDSDLRYQGKDRSAYFAYLLAKGKRAGASVWEAQKAFIDRELAGETASAEGLDPLVTIDADEASFEVFSRDESAYARLSLSNALFENKSATPGTTFFQVPSALTEGVGRLRSYMPVHFAASAEPKPGAALLPTERTAAVTEGWLKSFLQVQSAATLPAATCEIAPVDLYNILYVLTVRRAKKAPRALRFELVPGQKPRIVLEPWGVVLESHGAPFVGRTPSVIRTYGRQRLLVLARLLPHIRRARIALLGPGLPVFWILELGAAAGPLVNKGVSQIGAAQETPAFATLTLGLTGWTDSSWSSAAAFDRLVPEDGAPHLADAAVALLQKEGPKPLAAIATTLSIAAEKTRAALQRACLRGQVLFDVTSSSYRYRPLFASPVDDQVTRAATPIEARALRLLDSKGAVAITKEHVLAGQGFEVRGDVKDSEARRTYTPRFTLDLEGRVTEAWCNCPMYARSALREGPCEHMLALRTTFARARAAREALRDTPEGRATITSETRTLVRRDSHGTSETCRISLDGKRVRLAVFAERGKTRHQAFEFDLEGDARDEYFGRLTGFADRGFIDAADLPPMEAQNA